MNDVSELDAQRTQRFRVVEAVITGWASVSAKTGGKFICAYLQGEVVRVRPFDSKDARDEYIDNLPEGIRETAYRYPVRVSEEYLPMRIPVLRAG